MKKGNFKALLPIGVFLAIYLGLGITFEYVLKISMGFYNIPIIVAFLAAILVACLQNPSLSFDQKTEIMGRGVGDKNIIIMVLIFFTAGIFSAIVGRSGAQSVAYFLLSIVPAKLAVAMIFVIACFVSTAMGTSVGTITLIVPIAVEVALASGYSVPLCIGTVMGGSMFGDNLSFISDTTIAACNGQGCQMKDKFRENFWIALPAALATLGVILLLTLGQTPTLVLGDYNLLQVLPPMCWCSSAASPASMSLWCSSAASSPAASSRWLPAPTIPSSPCWAAPAKASPGCMRRPPSPSLWRPCAR